MKYNKDKLEKHIQELTDMSEYIIHDIIWEPQENQKDHFDKLLKSEQIALIDIGNKLKNAVDALTSYKHWFLQK